MPVLEGIRRRIADVAAVAPRAYWYVWWGTLINRLGGFIIPLLTIYLTTVRKLSVSEAGGIVSLFGAGSVAAAMVGGYLADRAGRKITLLISLFGGAAAMAALAFARDLAAIAVLVAMVGFLGELYRPAVLALVADVVPPANRMRAYALLHWVINIGFATAAIVGGLLASIDFTMLFIADAATMAIYGVIVFIAVPETRPAHRPQDALPGPQAAPQLERHAPAGSWLSDRVFVVFVALTFSLALPPYLGISPLAAHMTWQGFSTAEFGAVIAVNGVLVILLQPALSSWSAGREPTRMLIAAALFYGTGFALHGIAHHLVVHGIAVAVWTIGEILESPTRSTIVAAMAPTHARGRYQGAITMTFGMSALIGPKLGTWTWEHQGPSTLWAACGVLGIATSLGLLATAPARRRRLAAARS